jgi:hypothetical protein
MTKSKTHYKKLQDKPYIGSWDIEIGSEPIFTIDYVKSEPVTGERGVVSKCIVVYFKERDVKPLIANKTNQNTIARVYETPYIEDWSGKQIQLFVERVNFRGEMIDAIRIRNRIPVKNKENFTPSHRRWDEAVIKLKNGETTIEKIKSVYNLTVEAENQLTKLLEESAFPDTDTSEESQCQDINS